MRAAKKLVKVRTVDVTLPEIEELWAQVFLLHSGSMGLVTNTSEESVHSVPRHKLHLLMEVLHRKKLWVVPWDDFELDLPPRFHEVFHLTVDDVEIAEVESEYRNRFWGYNGDVSDARFSRHAKGHPGGFALGAPGGAAGGGESNVYLYPGNLNLQFPFGSGNANNVQGGGMYALKRPGGGGAFGCDVNWRVGVSVSPQVECLVIKDLSNESEHFVGAQPETQNWPAEGRRLARFL